VDRWFGSSLYLPTPVVFGQYVRFTFCLSLSYQVTGRYRGQSGRSTRHFWKPEFERQLFPEPAVQTTKKTTLRRAQNGHKRPLVSLEIEPKRNAR